LLTKVPQFFTKSQIDQPVIADMRIPVILGIAVKRLQMTEAVKHGLDPVFFYQEVELKRIITEKVVSAILFSVHKMKIGNVCAANA